MSLASSFGLLFRPFLLVTLSFLLYNSNLFASDYYFNPKQWHSGSIEANVRVQEILSGDLFLIKFDEEGFYRSIKRSASGTTKFFKQNGYNDSELSMTIRLFGVNTSMPALDEEVLATKGSLIDELNNKLIGSKCRIYCFMTDYWGRPICSLLYDLKYDLALWMIREGYTYYDLTYGIHPIKFLHDTYQKVDG